MNAFTEDCQREYDLAVACFKDDSEWTCEGLTGCEAELGDFDYCTYAYCPLPNNPACAVCDDVQNHCGWGARERCECRLACENDLRLEGDCQAPLDALAACVASADAWTCEGIREGCQQESERYGHCTSGQPGWACEVAGDDVEPWTKLSSLSTRTNVFVSDEHGWVYAGCGEPDGANAGLYVSKDGGLTFTPASAQLPQGQVSSIAIQAGTVYAVIDMLLFASADGGATWTQTGPDMLFGINSAVIADPFTVGTLYGLEMEGPKRSVDAGKSWTPIQEGLPTGTGSYADIRTLVPSPDTGGLLFAVPYSYAQTGPGIYLSSNHGDAWEPANTGMETAAISSLVVLSGGRLWAADQSGVVYRSVDAGQSWTTATIEHPCVGVYGETGVRFVSGQSLFATASTGELLESVDDGVSWSLVAKPEQIYPGIGTIFADPSGRFVLASADEGLLRYQPAQ